MYLFIDQVIGKLCIQDKIKTMASINSESVHIELFPHAVQMQA